MLQYPIDIIRSNTAEIHDSTDAWMLGWGGFRPRIARRLVGTRPATPLRTRTSAWPLKKYGL